MRPLLRLLAAAVLAAVMLTVPAAVHTHSADRTPPSGPLDALFITSGFTWADIDPEVTPNLHCFAQRSGLGAISLTSGSVMTTKRQGVQSLQTGARAEPLSTAPAAGESPDSANASGTTGTAEVHGVPVVDLGSVDNRPGAATAQRDASLRAIDAAFEQYAGPCGGAGSSKEFMLASVGIADPPPAEAVAAENERDTFDLYAPLELQVLMDSRSPGQLLTSGATRQPGLVTNLDLTPTLAAAGGQTSPDSAIGSPIMSADADDPRAHVVALSAQAVLIDEFTPPAVAVIALLTLTGAALLAFSLLRGRQPATLLLASRPSTQLRGRQPVAAAVGNGLVTIAFSMVSAGFIISVIPWAVSSAPAVLFAAGILVGGVGFAVIPWLLVRQPGLRPAAAAGVLGAVILIDSLTGSRLQLTSLLGNQPLYGGRFYGISNHLAGILLAAWIMGLIALLAARPHMRPWARVSVTGVSGLVVLVIAALPRFGADAGSSLLFGPVLLLAVIAVSGLRVRAWHLAAAIASGVVLVGAVGAADYLRGPGEWTHLGLFVSTLLNDPAAALGQQADRVRRMLEPLWLMPFLAVPVLLAIIAITVLALRSPALRAWDTRVPGARGLRAAGMIGAWIGALTNDTGLVLLTAAYVLGTIIQLALVSSDGSSNGSFGER